MNENDEDMLLFIVSCLLYAMLVYAMYSWTDLCYSPIFHNGDLFIQSGISRHCACHVCKRTRPRYRALLGAVCWQVCWMRDLLQGWLQGWMSAWLAQWTAGRQSMDMKIAADAARVLLPLSSGKREWNRHDLSCCCCRLLWRALPWRDLTWRVMKGNGRAAEVSGEDLQECRLSAKDTRRSIAEDDIGAHRVAQHRVAQSAHRQPPAFQPDSQIGHPGYMHYSQVRTRESCNRTSR